VGARFHLVTCSLGWGERLPGDTRGNIFLQTVLHGCNKSDEQVFRWNDGPFVRRLPLILHRLTSLHNAVVHLNHSFPFCSKYRKLVTISE
jgi:hypothetical protein